MVAIPTYLLASTAISSFRSPESTAKPSPTPAVFLNLHDQSDFTSVLGPITTDNFPDPAILYHNGVSYAFATNNKGIGPTE